MLTRSLQRRQRRTGAVVIEGAIAYPLFFILVLLMIVMSFGVFRYQEVSLLAHEAARFASVHGAEYHDDTTQTSPTEAQLRSGTWSTWPPTASQWPGVVFFFGQDPSDTTKGLGIATKDPDNLTITTTFNKADGTSSTWDSSNKAVYGYTSSTSSVLKQNTVSVTVRYNWRPELWPWPGATPVIALTSTSTMPMQY